MGAPYGQADGSFHEDIRQNMNKRSGRSFCVTSLNIRKRLYAEPWPLFFWCTAFLLLFTHLGYRSLWGSEGRWAEIAREMMISGDYFHPTINWAPYFDKPLFTYWVIVAAGWINGNLNEFAARFPSALAGLLTLWGTISLGQRIFSRKAGYLAAWILLTSYGMIFWSRTACADVENVAFILLAVLWYWHRREMPGFVSYAVFYLICAAGAHFKGLPAAVLPGLICFPDIIRGGRWRKYVSLSHAAAVCAGVVFYLAPFLYAAHTAELYGESGLYLVFRENILRFFNAFDHQEPPYVYLYYVPMLFLPWAPILIAALADAVRRYRQADVYHRWLVEAVAVIFFIYTLSDSRRSYYILPIMPFCALLAGNFLAGTDRSSWRVTAIRVQFFFTALIAVIEMLAPLVSPIVQKYAGIMPPAGLSTAFFIVGSTVLAVLLFFRKRGIAGCSACEGRDREDYCSPVAVIAATVILTAGFYCWQQNILEEYRSHRAFLHEVKQQVVGDIPASEVALNKNIASVVFYLGFTGPLRILETPEQVEAFLEERGTRYLIIQRRALGRAFAMLPEGMKQHPLMASELYPGQRRKKMQLLVWRLERPLQFEQN